MLSDLKSFENNYVGHDETKGVSVGEYEIQRGLVV
jgi:hypothetical protein